MDELVLQMAEEVLHHRVGPRRCPPRMCAGSCADTGTSVGVHEGFDPAMPTPAVVLLEDLCGHGPQALPWIRALGAGLVVEECGPG